MLPAHRHLRRRHHRFQGPLGGLTRLADWVVFGDPRLREDPRLLGIVWWSDMVRGCAHPSCAGHLERAPSIVSQIPFPSIYKSAKPAVRRRVAHLQADHRILEG